MIETTLTVALVLALTGGWMGFLFALVDGLETLWAWLQS